MAALGKDGSPLRNVLPVERLEQPPSLSHRARALYKFLELSWNYSTCVTSLCSARQISLQLQVRLLRWPGARTPRPACGSACKPPAAIYQL